MSLAIGSIVEGTITGITHFGAFVLLPTGETGLVHISEVADSYVKDIREHLQENDKVRVKVLSYEAKNRIGLSIKQATRSTDRRSQQSRHSFEEKLSRFIKDSDEKLSDLRRSTDARRGGRGGGRSS